MHWKHERRTKISGIIFFLCAAGVFFPLVAKDVVGYVDDYDKKIEEKHLALDSIKEELVKGREKLKLLQQEEGSCVSQLEQMEKNISMTENYVRRLNAKIDTTADSIRELEESLCGENSKLAARQAEMRRRLRSIYKTGQLDLPQIILSSRNMSDLLHRVRYFEALHYYDRRLIVNIDSVRSGIKIRKEAVEKIHAQLSLLKSEKEKECVALAREQKGRRAILDSVRIQKESYSAMVRDLESAQKELKNIIAILVSRKKKARNAKEQGIFSGFEKRKGALPWPVNGKVLTEFGKVIHSIYKTVVMNTGIDIGAEKGERVRCIASGTVAYVGWMRGFGKFVIVDHGGYYTTYAHMEDVAVEKDEEVRNGSVLGTAGDAGIVGGIKLHFEIRKSTEALDPIDWLEKRK